MAIRVQFEAFLPTFHSFSHYGKSQKNINCQMTNLNFRAKKVSVNA